MGTLLWDTGMGTRGWGCCWWQRFPAGPQASGRARGSTGCPVPRPPCGAVPAGRSGRHYTAVVRGSLSQFRSRDPPRHGPETEREGAHKAPLFLPWNEWIGGSRDRLSAGDTGALLAGQAEGKGGQVEGRTDGRTDRRSRCGDGSPRADPCSPHRAVPPGARWPGSTPVLLGERVPRGASSWEKPPWGAGFWGFWGRSSASHPAATCTGRSSSCPVSRAPTRCPGAGRGPLPTPGVPFQQAGDTPYPSPTLPTELPPRPSPPPVRSKERKLFSTPQFFGEIYSP